MRVSQTTSQSPSGWMRYIAPLPSPEAAGAAELLPASEATATAVTSTVTVAVPPAVGALVVDVPDGILGVAATGLALALEATAYNTPSGPGRSAWISVCGESIKTNGFPVVSS